MISTLSEILRAFMREESKKLSDYELKHNPSIGSMYEGLSANILRKAIPREMDLRVVDGFIVDASGNMSGQIDCMLVTGTGEKIPYTDSYKWPVWDVLAVFEVKKNLYGNDLADSFNHLKGVAKTYSDWVFSSGRKDQKINLSQAFKAFSTITGVVAPSYSEREDLPEPLQLMYHTLLIEQLSPVLIVFGYNGYQTESSLRKGLHDFIESNYTKGGYGVPSFPHLITCNGNSLVKMTGQPYMATMEGDFWPFYASSPSNPIWLLIELIWTKIGTRFSQAMPWGDDLEQEVMHRFLDAKPVLENESGGWLLKHIPFMDSEQSTEESEAWVPAEISDEEHVILSQLAAEKDVDLGDLDLVEFLANRGITVEEFVSGLRCKGLIALNGTKLELTTERLVTVVAPDGRILAGENNTGRMVRFVQSAGRKDEA